MSSFQHMSMENAGRKCVKHKLVDMSQRKCFICGGTDTLLQRQKIGLRPVWRKINGNLFCNRCYMKQLRKDAKMFGKKI